MITLQLIDRPLESIKRVHPTINRVLIILIRHSLIIRPTPAQRPPAQFPRLALMPALQHRGVQRIWRNAVLDRIDHNGKIRVRPKPISLCAIRAAVLGAEHQVKAVEVV